MSIASKPARFSLRSLKSLNWIMQTGINMKFDLFSDDFNLIRNIEYEQAGTGL